MADTTGPSYQTANLRGASEIATKSNGRKSSRKSTRKSGRK